MPIPKIRVTWETISGQRYEGVVVDIDSNVLIVKLDDGTIKAVEMGEGIAVIREPLTA